MRCHGQEQSRSTDGATAVHISRPEGDIPLVQAVIVNPIRAIAYREELHPLESLHISYSRYADGCSKVNLGCIVDAINSEAQPG